MNAAVESKPRVRKIGTPPLYEVQEKTFEALTPAENSLRLSLVKKPRAKRQRRFVVEFRLTPSKLGEFFGRTATAWEPEPFGDYRKLAEARRHILFSDALDPGYFTRGTEYRVRRTDTKVA